MILAVVVTALLFDPVRKWIQDRVDQFFYRTVYDYRRTLIEFGRELGSETDLERAALVGAGPAVAHAGGGPHRDFSARRGEPSSSSLSKSVGMNPMGKLDLTFLSAPRPEPAGHMFFENTHQVPRETAGSQDAIARLDLNYYIPCRAQQKTVAVLGLGKTAQGRLSLQRRH